MEIDTSVEVQPALQILTLRRIAAKRQPQHLIFGGVQILIALLINEFHS